MPKIMEFLILLSLFSNLICISHNYNWKGFDSEFIVSVESSNIRISIPSSLTNFKTFTSTSFTSIHKFTVRNLDNLLSFMNLGAGATNFFIFPHNETSLQKSIEQVAQFHHKQQRSWKDVYFLFFPKTENISVLDITIKNTIGQNRQILMDANIYPIFPFYTRHSNNCLFIGEFYDIKKSVPYFQEVFSQCSLRDVLLPYTLQQKVARRKFHGADIVATSGFELDYIDETKFGPDNSSFESGMAVSMFHDMKKYLNFTYSAIPGRWIVDNLKDSIDQLVINDKADIAISQTTLTLDTRNDSELFLTILQPTSSFKLFAFVTQPPARAIRNAVTMPFSNSTWIAYSLIFCILFTTVVILVRLTQHFIGKDYLQNEMDAFFAVVATICQQDFHMQRTSHSRYSVSLKLLMWTAYLTGSAMYIGYSAIIISFMSAHNFIPIKTVEDLKESNLQIYADSDYAWSPYVYEGTVDTLDLTKVLTPREALVKLEKETAAYLAFIDATTAAGIQMGLTEDFLCKTLSLIPFSKIDYKSSMFVKRGSPYREFLNYRIIAGKEYGLNYRYFKIYSIQTGLNCPSRGSKTQHKPLEFPDIFLPFLINLVGLGISLLVLTGEKLMMRSDYDHELFPTDLIIM